MHVNNLEQLNFSFLVAVTLLISGMKIVIDFYNELVLFYADDTVILAAQAPNVIGNIILLLLLRLEDQNRQIWNDEVQNSRKCLRYKEF